MRAGLGPYLLLATSAFLWGGNFVVARALSADIPPIAMNFWRFFGALIVLAPFTHGTILRHRRALLANWRLLLALGVTGVTTFHSFVYISLHSTTAINAALFMAFTPLAIPLLVFVLYRGTPTGSQVAGICASFVGVLVLISRGDLAALAAVRFNPGDLWMVAAFPCWALYIVLVNRRPPDLPPMALLIGMMAMGVALLVPLYLWEYARVGGIAVTRQNLLGLGFLAIFASAVAYFFWNRGVGEIGPTRAGPFMYLVPVFATLLALIFLGEQIHLYQAVGAVLIVFGIIVTADWRRRMARTVD